jgi:hypothetical protein
LQEREACGLTAADDELHDDYIERAWTGSAKAEGGHVEVKYAEKGRDVVPPFKGGRTSFHSSSGQINLADQELEGAALPDRTKQEILCTLVFEHPSSFPSLGAVGHRDILLPFAIAEDRALVGVVHFVPPGKEVAFEPGLREIGAPLRELVIRFAGVDASTSGDLTLYVAIGRGPRLEAWPPASYLLVGTREPIDTEKVASER